MNRPYIIIQVAASIDGRISLGPDRTMFEDLADSRTIYHDFWTEVEEKIAALHQPEADMLGSNSLVKEVAELKPLPEYPGNPEPLYRDYLPEEVVRRKGHRGWMVVVDGRGRVRSGFKESDDRPGWHMLHLVSHGVSLEYLAFLQEKKIPYLITGEKRVNLQNALEKMKEKLGVQNLVHSSGGKLGGALLREGLIDEVNLIIQPQIIGGSGTPILFESPDLGDEEVPAQLKLITTQIHHDGFIWLRYKINN